MKIVDPEPVPEDHPWREMPNHALTIHYSGLALNAQHRIIEMTHEILRHTWIARSTTST
jgi:formate dehydrogenase